MSRVSTPVEGFDGEVAGVHFVGGHGETDDQNALNYFARHGYTVEAGEKKATRGRKASEPKGDEQPAEPEQEPESGSDEGESEPEQPAEPEQEASTRRTRRA